MKNFTLLLSILFSSFLYAQIPNGGFEEWEELGPLAWPDVAPSEFSSANDQFFYFSGELSVFEVPGETNSGIRLETIDVNGEAAGAYAIWGEAPDGGDDELIFGGGFPFSDSLVTGIEMDLRYDVNVLSPAIVLVQFKLGGEVISNATFVFEVSGEQSTFTSTTFNFPLALSVAPDQCVIAFTSNNLLEDEEIQLAFTGDYIEIDNIQFTGTSDLVPGGNLDNWIEGDPILIPEDWQAFTPPGQAVVEQSDDSYEGNYALKINNFIGDSSIVQQGMAYLGEFSGENLLATLPLPSDVISLNYQYKYEGANGDSALVFLILSEDIENTEEGMYYSIQIIGDASEYTQGVIDFSDVFDFLSPQYYSIVVMSANPFGFDSQPQLGSSLWVDAFEWVLDPFACEYEPTIEQGDIILCPDEVVTINTQEYDSYQWYSQNIFFGDPVLLVGDTLQSLDVDATNFAINNVWCEVTLDGCTESTDPVYIDGYAFLPPAISSNGINDICEGDSTLLENAFGAYGTYQWEESGEEIEGADDNQFWVTESGNFTLTVTPMECPDYAMNNGVAVSITVHDLPTPVIQLEGSDLSTTESFEEYQWYMNGNEVDGADDANYELDQDGQYFVEVVDQWGCEGISDTFTYVGVKDFTNENMSIYPNPATEDVWVVLSQGLTTDGSLIIYDLLGNQIRNERIMKKQTKIDLTNVSPGVYFVQVSNDTQDWTVKLIVK